MATYGNSVTLYCATSSPEIETIGPNTDSPLGTTSADLVGSLIDYIFPPTPPNDPAHIAAHRFREILWYPGMLSTENPNDIK